MFKKDLYEIYEKWSVKESTFQLKARKFIQNKVVLRGSLRILPMIQSVFRAFRNILGEAT